jgi:hypothetical protein
MAKRKKQKSEDELNDEAADLLMSFEADEFARALDRLGWMIVVQSDGNPLAKHRWSMNQPGEYPSWAEPSPFDEPAAKSAEIVPFPKP